MAAPIVVACSHCSAELKLKSASMVGKKVRCPKCSEPFLIQLSKKNVKEPVVDDGGFYDDPDEEWGDDFGDLSDFEEPIASNPKKRKGSGSQGTKKRSGKKKKGGKSSFPWNLVIAVGGGLAFLLLIATGVYFVLPLLGGSANRMQWLPNDTQTYVEIRVSEVWNADVMRPVRTSPMGKKLKEQITKNDQFAIEDVEKIVIGIPASGQEPIVVLHATKTIDPTKINVGTTTSTYAGRTLYEQIGGKNVVFLLDSQTMVAGPKSLIQAAIDRKGACAVAEQFGFLPARGDIIFGSLSPGDSLRNSPAAMLSQSTIDPQKIKTIAGALNLSRDLEINLTMEFTDAAIAAEAFTEAQTNLSKAKKDLQKQQETLESGNFVINRQQKAMVLKVKDVMNSVVVNGSGTEMNTRLKVSGSMIEDLVEMMNGHGGGGFLPQLGGGLGNPF